MVFLKRSLWLAVVVAVSFLVGLGIVLATQNFSRLSTVDPSTDESGQEASRRNRDRPPLGKWTKVRRRGRSRSGTGRDYRGLGYLGGVKKGSPGEGVVQYKPEKTLAGYNLYVSGHAPAAYLIDMKGNVVHRWKLPWSKAFPTTRPGQASVKVTGRTAKSHSRFWRAARLLKGGKLLAIFEGKGLVKIDRHSNLIWKKKLGVHHDVWVSEDQSRYYVLTREKTRVSPGGILIYDDLIVVLNQHGDVLKRVSLFSALKNSQYSHLLRNAPIPGDIFHTNDIDVLTDVPDDFPGSAENGDALVSVRNMSFVGIVDLENETFEWVLEGMTERQHDPDLLGGGNLLIFDNRNRRVFSRVIEYEPATSEIVWDYTGNRENGFFTDCCGTNQRLQNGNTLITETGNGRAFELTPGKEIVWEFRTPHTAGSDNQYIAQLFEMKRLPPGVVEEWLEVEQQP